MPQGAAHPKNGCRPAHVIWQSLDDDGLAWRVSDEPAAVSSWAWLVAARCIGRIEPAIWRLGVVAVLPAGRLRAPRLETAHQFKPDVAWLAGEAPALRRAVLAI